MPNGWTLSHMEKRNIIKTVVAVFHAQTFYNCNRRVRYNESGFSFVFLPCSWLFFGGIKRLHFSGKNHPSEKGSFNRHYSPFGIRASLHKTPRFYQSAFMTLRKWPCAQTQPKMLYLKMYFFPTPPICHSTRVRSNGTSQSDAGAGPFHVSAASRV